MFSPLQVISSYSLLQSPLKLDDYISYGIQLGYKVLTLTDINVMYGTLKFYHLCNSYNIKPLIGLTLELSKNDEIILLAENADGYHNLMKISTYKMLKLKKKDNILNLNNVKSLLNNIIAIIPYGSKLFNYLSDKKYENAKRYINNIISFFDSDHLFLGVNPNIGKQNIYILRKLGKFFNLNLVAYWKVKYLKSKDKFYEDVLNSIKNNKILSPEQLINKSEGLDYLESPQIIFNEFKNCGLEDAYLNTEKIIDSINLKLKFNNVQLPHFINSVKKSSKDYLRNLCYEGLEKRISVGKVDKDTYYKRLDYELNTIHKMGFDDYFLIVWDVTNFAHTHDIIIGPGRGSSAGSLVSYCLFITDVDPIKFGLLFERFLNEKRSQLPDIDLDIPDQRRNEIIKYVCRRYGKLHVAQIITFSHLNARQVLHDVSHVMGKNSTEISQWSESMPHNINLTLKYAYENSAELRSIISDSYKNELIFNTACYLEGIPRQYSTHAAGIVLSDKNLIDYVPLQAGSDNIYLTQFDKSQVEKVGLLKIDFLGLRNLTILESAIAFIKKTYDFKFDIKNISLNDNLTLKLFKHADTNGIFQFESIGIKRLLKEMEPNRFEDIVAVNALYRPGPMQNINEFITRRAKRSLIPNLNGPLKSILGKTYGIIVYQEQVMQVASRMAGFSLSEADLLRNAISKKNQSLIDSMRNKFIAGSVHKGYSKQEAINIYNFIEKFGNYGFNRSHAVAYTKLAYELAYIKSHYASAFYVALLNSVIGNSDKMHSYIDEAKHHGVRITVPDINISSAFFNINKNKDIIFGFKGIRGLNTKLILRIIDERKKNGIYISIIDFIRRNNSYLNHDILDLLIYSGVFDSLENDRNKLLGELPIILDSIKFSNGNLDLLQELKPKPQKLKTKFPISYFLQKEKEHLSSYISKHPVDEYKAFIKYYHTVKLSHIYPNQQNINVIAYINDLRKIKTKSGLQMSFIKISDDSGDLDVTVFPEQFIQYGKLLNKNKIIFINGKSQIYKNKLRFIANYLADIKDLSHFCYYLRIDNFDVMFKNDLLKLMTIHHGNIPVILYERNTNHAILMDMKYWLDDKAETLISFKRFLGDFNAKLDDFLH